jgi:hypothetical protein
MSSKLAKLYHGNVKKAFSNIFGKVVKQALELLLESGKEILDLQEICNFIGGN